MDHPYTRGYLLYGNPGTGKTSTIKGISNECRRHIHYLSLNEIENDNELSELIGQIKFKETILVIEDIDAMTDIIHKKEEIKKIETNEISNKLDKLEKKMDFFTVNSISKIDEKSATYCYLNSILLDIYIFRGFSFYIKISSSFQVSTCVYVTSSSRCYLLPVGTGSGVLQ